MASRNPDSLTNQQGEFHASKPRDEPLTTHGHKPGLQVGNDAFPEFTAQTLPAGSAPASNTFTPNPSADPTENLPSTETSAADTLGGATSADVHTGLGHPGQGQTSNELRHGTQGTSKKEAGGSAFASGAPGGNLGADERVQESQRGLEREGGGLAGTRGDKGGEYGAGEVPNESA
ncbi:MAG: hypothetical protein Q9195_008165 [Heterodermia aff. obscurata]